MQRVRTETTKCPATRLIKVDDGFNLWSKSFDRELTDIFAVQDDIAGTVLASLKPNVVAEAPERAATRSRRYC
jgi:TolB-like protein